MARTVIIGDVHGCVDELERLLEVVQYTPGDRVVFVGDLVVRGPDSPGALALARRAGARAVRGNHENKLLAWRRGERVDPDHAKVAASLSDEDWRQLEAMPLWLDLPENGVRVVHGGVIPGESVERAAPEAILKMRTIDARGRWSDAADAGPLWGTRYVGPPHVVFGHNAHKEPQFHPWATGIDTGCVYGNRLTAVVLERGQPMPRGEAARSQLHQVRARRRYYGDGKGPLAG